MIKFANAKLAYLASPEPDLIYLNAQTCGGEFTQFTLTREQLANLVIDGARLLARMAVPPITRDGEL